MLETDIPCYAKKGWLFEIPTSKINLKISKEESSCSHLHEGLAILMMGKLVSYSWSVFIRYVLIADHSFTSSVIIQRPDKALPQVIIWPMPNVIWYDSGSFIIIIIIIVNTWQSSPTGDYKAHAQGHGTSLLSPQSLCPPRNNKII